MPSLAIARAVAALISLCIEAGSMVVGLVIPIHFAFLAHVLH